MKDSYKISVIVPIYNVEPYLEMCVNSIINQTYQNIEIILVDDGSPDRCGEMCDEYAQKDNRIVVIHKKNGGLSSARNAGLNISTGDFIMFVDSDDWVEKNFCETPLNEILKKEVDCLAFGYFKHEDEKIITKTTNHPRFLNAEKAISSIINHDDIIYNFAVNKIYRRHVFNEIRFPEGRLFEDQGTTYRIFDLVGKIYVSDIPLYHYISRTGSIIKQGYKPKAINDKFDLWLERLQFLKKKYPSVYFDQLKILTLYVDWALKVIGWDNNKPIRIKMEKFLKDYKNDILALNINSKLIHRFFIFYPAYYIDMKFRLGKQRK